jgi:hypothetical protein
MWDQNIVLICHFRFYAQCSIEDLKLCVRLLGLSLTKFITCVTKVSKSRKYPSFITHYSVRARCGLGGNYHSLT